MPAADDAAEVPEGRPTTSTRDLERVRASLAAWLRRRASDAEVRSVRTPGSSGMSSETFLFDATWTDDSGEHDEALVARLAPEDAAVPTFPVYDLGRQARVLRLVAERTSVPVPAVRWFEPDPEHLGSPFLVMERLEGRVPADVPPYVMTGWLLDASPSDRRRLQEGSVRVLADLHALEASEAERSFLDVARPGVTPLRRHVADQQAYYEWVVADGVRSPLLERAFGWLDEHWPQDEGPAVVSWGDARVGNILYRGFEPAAVLDWEMAALAPRELDLGWMIALHGFFQEIAGRFGLGPGLPDLFRRTDVVETYEAASGHRVRSLAWYETYAALRHGIVLLRVARRAAHFGEATMPADPDDAVMHRRMLEAMLDGSYFD